jgi:hypothetical protein
MKSRFGLVLLFIIVAAHWCHATTVNFDNVVSPMALSNQYAAQGVIFNQIEATGQFTTSVVPVSSPNYATPFYFSAAPGSLSFVDPANPSNGAITDSVTITLNGFNNVGGWFSGATIDAIDAFGNVIAGQTQTVAPTNGTAEPNTNLTFTGQIQGLRFTNIPNPSGLGIFPFDDLTFGALTPVPEPSMSMFGIAGLALFSAWMARRRGVRQ